jgi:hypothetical protein
VREASLTTDGVDEVAGRRGCQPAGSIYDASGRQELRSAVPMRRTAAGGDRDRRPETESAAGRLQRGSQKQDVELGNEVAAEDKGISG